MRPFAEVILVMAVVFIGNAVWHDAPASVYYAICGLTVITIGVVSLILRIEKANTP